MPEFSDIFKRTNNLQLADLGKHAVAFALDARGSRFIQQKLERANPTENTQFVDALRGHVLTLSQQVYGCYVIRKALESVDKPSQIKIINEISAQVTTLSLHEYGNWVIRHVIEHCTEQQKRPVLEQLLDNVPCLVMDQYGSYVIQHVFEHGLPEDRGRIVRNLQEDIMKYAQDKFGCLVILKCLICGTADQKRALFDNVWVGGPQTLQNVRQLMADEFGHYVIEKFFEYGTDDQKAQLVDALRGHVLELALQMYGNHVIRAALKSVDKASQIEIIEELTPRSCVIRCIKDQYGSHVMETIFELIVEPQRLQFVVDAILSSPSDSVVSLSLHEYASRVIERVLEYCTKQQKRPVLEQLLDNVPTLVTDQYGSYVIQHVLKHCTEQQKRPVLKQLLDNVPTLVADQYGNYVIQYVVEHGRPEDRERIVRSLQGGILKNIHRKSICNIIEKCLIFGTTEQKNALIDQVCADDGTGKTPLLQMMHKQFANDVVLKMVDSADSAHRDKMMLAIEEHIPALLKRQQSLNTVQAKPRDERRTVADKRKKRRNGLLDD